MNVAPDLISELQRRIAVLEATLIAERAKVADLEARLRGDRYDRGRRDVLNAILALNPDVARRLHKIRGDGVPFSNQEGKLPFDVVFWVAEVAAQLGIEPTAE